MVPARGWRGLMGGARSKSRLRSSAKCRRSDRQRQPSPDSAGSPRLCRRPARAARRDRSRSRRWPPKSRERAVPAGRGAARHRRNLREALRLAVDRMGVAVARLTTATRAIEVFVGPPGAGKTTTIAKIAAQERARRGAAAAARRGRRLPRRRGRAAAPLRRHPRRAVHCGAHAIDLDRALVWRLRAGARRHRGPFADGRRGAGCLSRSWVGRAASARIWCCPPRARPRGGAAAFPPRRRRARRIVLTKLDEAESSSPLVRPA